MKKVLALVLALTMVLGMGSVALAEGNAQVFWYTMSDTYLASVRTALNAKLDEAGIRVETDLRNEKIGYKIREAQMQKLPYMLVVGDKESENGTVSVRTRSGVDLGAMSLDAFLSRINEEISTKAK